MRATRQKRFHVKKFPDGSGWYVDGRALTPIVSKGQKKIGRIKEQFPTEQLAQARCDEINDMLFGRKSIPMQPTHLKPDQLELAAKIFVKNLPEGTGLEKLVDWAITNDITPAKMKMIQDATNLLPTGTDWVGLANWALKNNYKPAEKAPYVPEAWASFIKERATGTADVKRVSNKTLEGLIEEGRFITVKFATFKPADFTISSVLGYTAGDDILMRQTGTFDWEKNELVPGEIVKSKTRRPWCWSTQIRVIKAFGAFLNWCYKKDWRSKITIPRPIEPDEHAQKELPSLYDTKHGNAKAQALLDAAWAAYGGKFAAYYVQNLFGGARVSETRRTGAADFRSADGVLSIPGQAAKKKKGRESIAIKHSIFMVETLRLKGQYNDENLRPSKHERRVIQVLAGFLSTSKSVLDDAEKERQQIDILGLPLTKEKWGERYPQNAMRRTALSAHYQLYQSVSTTVEWAGNGKKIFRDYYKRLCTKAGAAEYWTMLPTVLKQMGAKISLPEGHKLDSALDPEIVFELDKIKKTLSSGSVEDRPSA